MVSLRAGCDARFQSGITVKNKVMMTFQKAQVWHLQTGHGGSCPISPAVTQVPGPAPDALWPRPAPDSRRRESASAPAGPSLCPSWVDQRALSGRHLGELLSQRTQEGRSLSAQQGVRRRAGRSLSSLWLTPQIKKLRPALARPFSPSSPSTRPEDHSAHPAPGCHPLPSPQGGHLVPLCSHSPPAGPTLEPSMPPVEGRWSSGFLQPEILTALLLGRACRALGERNAETPAPMGANMLGT